MDSLRFNKTIEAFDEVNAQDPNVDTYQGEKIPKELLYAQRMSACLMDFMPQAPEALKLAARSQHIKRWEIARNSFPADRAGYFRWRSKLNEMHAKIAGDIMLQNGYTADAINQVSNLLLKKGLSSNDEAQVLEDVVCIVFLKYYFRDFALKHEDEKIKNILLKTMGKMSAKGIDYAKQLDNANLFLKYLG